MAIEDVLIPIFVCVVLPVAIVWIVNRARQNEINRKSEIMLKAIEAGLPVDTELLKPAARQKSVPRSLKQDLLEKLTGACITTFMGVAFLAMALVQHLVPDFDIFFGEFMLPAGCVMLAVGIALFITYYVGKKMMAKEIEAEEKALDEPRQ